MADRYFSTEEEAIQDLVRRGLIEDSGRRRWCKRSRSYQIVWKCTKLGAGLFTSRSAAIAIAPAGLPVGEFDAWMEGC
jgi:hypothetical protein